MENEELIQVLSELTQLDIDAVYSYNQAIEGIEDAIIRERLSKFLKEHNEHIDLLSKEIRAHGGQPPEISPDLKGVVIKGVTALRSSSGTKGALKALKMMEEMTNQRYGDLIPRNFPPSTHDILRKCFSDEKSHLEYIVMNLEALSL
jgi:hypothetical protein